MKEIRFFSRLSQFWSSARVRQIRRNLRPLRILHRWSRRSWKFKVQFLIGLTAVFLLFLSVTAWFVHEWHFSRISDNFIRLRFFCPQEIFYSISSPSKTQAVSNVAERVPEEVPVNYCPFYAETRKPFGRPLPNVRIQATLKTPEGVPFWFHSDETGADGTFRLPVPDMPSPSRTTLTIQAVDGKRTAEFTAFLRVTPQITAEMPGLEEEFSPKFHDESLSSVSLQQNQAQNSFRLDVPPHDSFTVSSVNSSAVPKSFSVGQNPVSMKLSDRILETPEAEVSIRSRDGLLHPVLLGIWQDEVLTLCRPFAAGKRSRKLNLPLPKEVRGLLSILLIDCSVSPPQVLQHELIYRLPEKDKDAETLQKTFLHRYVTKMQLPEFREKEQNLEYLPSELGNPVNPADSSAVELVNSPETIPSAEGTIRVSVPDSEQSPPQNVKAQNYQNSQSLAAAERLLASALLLNLDPVNRFSLPELREFRQLLAHLDQLTLNLSDPQEAESGKGQEASETSNAKEESIHALMHQSLQIQSAGLNQTSRTARAQKSYLQNLPILYDSLTELESSYQSEVVQFRTTARNQLSSLACIILCSAICLVLLMLKMSILGLPTNWKNWFLTFVVVLLAFGLAYWISNQSNFEKNHANIRYSIFAGSPAELPTQPPKIR